MSDNEKDKKQQENIKMVLVEFELDGEWRIKCPNCVWDAKWRFDLIGHPDGVYKCPHCGTLINKPSNKFNFSYADRKLNKSTGGLYK